MAAAVRWRQTAAASLLRRVRIITFSKMDIAERLQLKLHRRDIIDLQINLVNANALQLPLPAIIDCWREREQER